MGKLRLSKIVYVNSTTPWIQRLPESLGFTLFDPCWLYPDTMMIHAVDDRLSIPITSNGGFLKMGVPKMDAL